jgi:hypothetical protein
MKPSGSFIVIVILLVLFGIYGITRKPPEDTPVPVKTHSEIRQLQVELEKQPDRLIFIQEVIERGVFQKVEVPAKFPHVWVQPAFYNLDFDTKTALVNVVWSYHILADPERTMVVLYDSQTGKQVGEYAEPYGGLRMK